jgi:hypothetical protein
VSVGVGGRGWHAQHGGWRWLRHDAATCPSSPRPRRMRSATASGRLPSPCARAVFSWRPGAPSFGAAAPQPPPLARSSVLKYELVEDEGEDDAGGGGGGGSGGRCPRRLGTVYFDLAPRPHKFGGAAHFVVRCGKLAHEYDGGLERALGVPPAFEVSASGEDGGGGGEQLPIVVLVASLGSGGHGAVDPEAVGLSPAEVETLFHEAGHALHSLLSRTEFQHLHGGCPTERRGLRADPPGVADPPDCGRSPPPPFIDPRLPPHRPGPARRHPRRHRLCGAALARRRVLGARLPRRLAVGGGPGLR